MATLFPNTTLKGLLPGIDVKQVGQQYCVEGSNFMLDARSVYTAFGSQVAHFVPVDYPKASHTFQLENSSDLILCTATGLYLIEEAQQEIQSIYTVPADIAPVINNWPWTKAYVGGVHYFCKRGVGVVSYNPNTKVVNLLTGANIPVNPSFVVAASGRLVILGDDRYQWSAFDDGADLQTSTATRAGAQFTALLGGGEPRALFTVTGGFYVATSQGVIKATYTDGPTLYEHDVVEGTSLAPIDPNSWTSVEDRFTVVATQTGLYRFTTRGYEIWQPVMSEYIHRQITPTYRSASVGVIKLSYLESLKYLFVSFSTTSVEGIYTHSFVYDEARDEWGSFDQQHVAVGPVPVQDAELYQWEYGYIDQLGYIRTFIEVPQKQGVPTTASFQLPLTQTPPLVVNDVTEPSSRMNMSSVDLTVLPPYPGFYEQAFVSLIAEVQTEPTQQAPSGSPQIGENWNLQSGSEDWNTETGSEDWNAGDDYVEASSTFELFKEMLGVELTKTDTVYENLQSDVLVGPYRLIDEQYPDRLSYVTDTMVAMEDPKGNVETEDWNEDAPAEDWNLLTGSEDWGEIAIAASDYQIELIPTIDGKKTYLTTEVPTLQVEDGETITYASHSTGLFHFVRITANEQNESFRMKLLELSGTLGGRLS